MDEQVTFKVKWENGQLFVTENDGTRLGGVPHPSKIDVATDAHEIAKLTLPLTPWAKVGWAQTFNDYILWQPG